MKNSTDYKPLSADDAALIKWAVSEFPKHLDAINYINKDAVKVQATDLARRLTYRTLYVRGKC
jgi:hypothetical protein